MTTSLFEDVLSANFRFFRGKRLLAAFSGGKDSLALLDFLTRRKTGGGYFLAACHVNHGLREKAPADENFCENFCRSRGVPFFCVRAEENILKGTKRGTEAAARKFRYKALRETALKNGFDLILTAHTFDDEVESFFTDIYTGASIFTLGGVAFKKGMIMRPMLEATSAMAEDYIRRMGLEPVFDESNDDLRFVRNRIRRKALPALYECGKDFVPTVLRIQEDSARLNDYFRRKTQKAVLRNDEVLAEIDADTFSSFEDVEKEYLLGRLFSERFRLSRAHTAEALSLTGKKGSKRVHMPEGYVFEKSFRKLRLFKKTLAEAFLVEKERGIDTIDISGVTAVFSGKLTEAALTLRNRREGDRFRGRRLKDIFIDRKIDLFQRDRAILIEKDGEIIWVEGVSPHNENIIVKRLY